MNDPIGEKETSDKLKKRATSALTILFSTLSVIASILGIYSFFFLKDELIASCKLKFMASKLTSSSFTQASNEFDTTAYFDPNTQTFNATIEFSEKVRFGLGDQIFSDTQRIFAIQNITNKLLSELTSLDKIQSHYSTEVEFEGGADATGGDGYFSKLLDIGKLRVSVRNPKVNGIAMNKTVEFSTGQKVNNTDLALVRSAFVSHIFITELNKLSIRPHISDFYVANTYSSIGPEYRYGKINVTIEATKKNAFLDQKPEILEIACELIS